jgi:hypothetical protein
MHESKWLFVLLDMVFLYQTISYSFHLTWSKDQKLDPIDFKDEHLHSIPQKQKHILTFKDRQNL